MVPAIENIAKDGCYFKIGKTGQTVEERFKSDDYNTYDRFSTLHSSGDQSEVDELEKTLIEHFRSSTYEEQCENKVSDNHDMKESGEYHVYVVYRG